MISTLVVEEEERSKSTEKIFNWFTNKKNVSFNVFDENISISKV